jgi:DNA replication protein
MEKFKGFPARMRFTPVPNLFFTGLMPQIKDMAELKTTLYVIWLVYSKKGYPRYASFSELLGSRSLAGSLAEGDIPVAETLRTALQAAEGRGTLIHLVADRDGEPEDIYLLNTEAERKTAEKIRNGEMAIAGLKAAGVLPEPDAGEMPNIYTLYEQNIGMLTPIIAEELAEAEKLYPAEWIRDAVREAVSLNKRNWRYIARILENWAAEGKSDGTHRGDTKKGADRYAGQKYGQIFKR